MDQQPRHLICPECAQGKCVNCTGLAWDDRVDDLVSCDHLTVGHGVVQ